MTLNAERIAVARPALTTGPAPTTRPATGRRPSAERTAAGGRDAAIDAARAGCLVVVFLLHAMMVGVSVGADGPVLENALEGWAWFAPATWVVQVMPLFFVIGGFAGWTSWRRMQQRGQAAADFVRGRLARLVRPAIALVAVVATALAALAMAGLPAETVATAGYRIGQPLWFLAVYIACSSLVPVMARLHARHPLATIAGLLAVVVAVDAVRFATGIDAIGFANLLAVWLLVQQGGFFLADGSIERMPRGTRLGATLAAFGVLLALTVAGPYSPDLLMNLNPPTVCLVVLGVAQLALFSLARPTLRRWADRPRPARAIASFGEWGMTLYLWHMPAFVAIAGVLLVLHEVAGLSLPVPLTEEWWGSRPLWLVVAALGTAALVRVFGRFERQPVHRPVHPPAAAASPDRGIRGLRALVPARLVVPLWLALPAAVAGVGVALVVGFAPLPALVALTLLGIALAGSRPASTPVGGSAVQLSRPGTP
ncbi:acyltransferase family protein [Agromyces sp. Marseille-Q5079]|uniref:acyltransferase family protein n=1 Tax=Agromyces sp. Marseille-Q5079 TaxID=3439059 RepID=UPI003D9C958D